MTKTIEEAAREYANENMWYPGETSYKTMRLTLTYPELAQEYYDSLNKIIPDNEQITIS